MLDTSEDTIDDYRQRREDRQARHRKNKKYNTDKLNASGIEYRASNPECFLFRGGQRQADFYPSSGRWKDIATKEVISGGVNKFIAWLDGRETW